MENENNFKETVSSLFKGMDGFVAAKTVVGDAIHVGDTIILPLVDVSFGVGAGAFAGEKKNNGGGGLAGKMTPCAVLVDFGMCFCRSEDRENLQKCSEAVSLHKIY